MKKNSPCEASDFWWRSGTDFLHDLRLRHTMFMCPLIMWTYLETTIWSICLLCCNAGKDLRTWEKAAGFMGQMSSIQRQTQLLPSRTFNVANTIVMPIHEVNFLDSIQSDGDIPQYEAHAPMFAFKMCPVLWLNDTTSKNVNLSQSLLSKWVKKYFVILPKCIFQK